MDGYMNHSPDPRTKESKINPISKLYSHKQSNTLGFPTRR